MHGLDPAVWQAGAEPVVRGDGYGARMLSAALSWEADVRGDRSGRGPWSWPGSPWHEDRLLGRRQRPVLGGGGERAHDRGRRPRRLLGARPGAGARPRLAVHGPLGEPLAGPVAVAPRRAGRGGRVLRGDARAGAHVGRLGHGPRLRARVPRGRAPRPRRPRRRPGGRRGGARREPERRRRTARPARGRPAAARRGGLGRGARAARPRGRPVRWGQPGLELAAGPARRRPRGPGAA